MQNIETLNTVLLLCSLVTIALYSPVMWSKTVGLRTIPVSDQKISVLVLVFVPKDWCCVVKHGLVTLVVIVTYLLCECLCRHVL